MKMCLVSKILTCGTITIRASFSGAISFSLAKTPKSALIEISYTVESELLDSLEPSSEDSLSSSKLLE